MSILRINITSFTQIVLRLKEVLNQIAYYIDGLQALHVLPNHIHTAGISWIFFFFVLIFDRVRAVKKLNSSITKNKRMSNNSWHGMKLRRNDLCCTITFEVE